MTVEVSVLDPWGNHHQIVIHIACENSRAARLAQQRYAGMRGRN
jgi:hypothetical protein